MKKSKAGLKCGINRYYGGTLDSNLHTRVMSNIDWSPRKFAYLKMKTLQTIGKNLSIHRDILERNLQ